MPLRLKLTPRTDGDVTHLKLEWVNVDGEQIGETMFAEEFRIGKNREGCAYISRVEFIDAQVLPGTFWLDEAGRRHFRVDADAGQLTAFGQAAG